MKKIILLIALLYSLTFSQQWNDLKQTTIQQLSLPIKMDVFTNSSGNHILIEASNGNIIYYNVNSSGIVDVTKTETIESNGDFPTITGSSDKIYIFYKIGTNIKMKYSTDGGGNWIYNSSLDRQINSSICNGIDAVYEDGLAGGIHLVWATNDNGSDYETYYYRLNTKVTPFQWVEGKNVTDVTNYQYGGNPSVAVSTNRVHISWNTNSGGFPLQGNANLRDRYNGVWQSPQPVVSGSEESGYEMLIVQGSTLYMFYTQFDFGSGENRWDMDFRTRSISGTVWSASTEITTAIALIPNSFNVVKSFDNVIHLACLKTSDVLIYYNSNSWNSFYEINSNPDPGMPTALTNISNDLFSFSWKPYDERYLMLRQYDAAPLTPTNFAGTTYNNHPKLTWTLNNGPDVAYEIHRKVSPLGEPAGTWQLLTDNVSASTSSYVDNGFEITGQHREGFAEYKIRARDSLPSYSPYTNSVSYTYYGVNKMIQYEADVFSLSQNYPNPFNPSTVISYSIPFEGSVRVRVFNTLGEIVSELVNQTQTAGEYQTTFDAGNLASGMYFYSIEAVSSDGSQNLKEVKKMLLQK